MPDRTTIVMPKDLKIRAVAKARAAGLSFGEYVRSAIEKDLSGGAKKVAKIPWRKSGKKIHDPFWDNLAIYKGTGDTDLSANHDEYLYSGKR